MFKAYRALGKKAPISVIRLTGHWVGVIDWEKFYLGFNTVLSEYQTAVSKGMNEKSAMFEAFKEAV